MAAVAKQSAAQTMIPADPAEVDVPEAAAGCSSVNVKLEKLAEEGESVDPSTAETGRMTMV